MSNPFPLPAKFCCPYCGMMCDLVDFEITGDAKYVCLNTKRVSVSKIKVTLWTRHTFYIRWIDDKWCVVDRSHYGSKEIEEMVRSEDWTTVKKEVKNESISST